MIRKIVSINEERCNGCGLCAKACHEGAIAMINGKAKLIRDDYCDGLGDCLPACPMDAICIIEREAAAYDEEAVKARQAEKSKSAASPCGGHSCPGSRAKTFVRPTPVNAADSFSQPMQSQLSQWLVQIRLVAPNAPYFENAHLLIAADCTPFAYADFHNRFIKNRITLVGCPKLDPVDYSEKLTAILKNHNIKSVTLVRMEVPCCGGLEQALKKALTDCGKLIPWQVHVISTDGRLLD